MPHIDDFILTMISLNEARGHRLNWLKTAEHSVKMDKKLMEEKY